MQTPRERLLSVLLLGAIFIIGGGFIGYQFLYKPVAERELTVANLQAEIDTANTKARAIERDLPRLAKLQRRSLPFDIDMARREYEGQISRMLREAQFVPTSISMQPSPPDVSGVPLVASRKPAYTRLDFRVSARGELINLVDFLVAFYQLDLLHRIKQISVIRPQTSRGPESKRNEIEVTFNLEALVLDTAEKRKTLLTATPTGITVLASANRDYGAIAGKDVFFGTPPPPPIVQTTQSKLPEMDLTPYVRLTSITRSGMWTPEEQTALGVLGGGVSLMAPEPGEVSFELWDTVHNHTFKIDSMPDGTRSQGFFYLRNEKKRMVPSPYLSLGEEADGSRRFYRVIRLESESVVLQQVDPRGGTRVLGGLIGGGGFLPAIPEPVVRWRIGDLLKDAFLFEPEAARIWIRPLPPTRSRGL